MTSRARRAMVCLGRTLTVVVGSPASAARAVVRGPWSLVTLPALGTVTWRCDTRGRPTAPGLGALGLGFHVQELGATTNIRLHIGSDDSRSPETPAGAIHPVPVRPIAAAGARAHPAHGCRHARGTRTRRLRPAPPRDVLLPVSAPARNGEYVPAPLGSRRARGHRRRVPLRGPLRGGGGAARRSPLSVACCPLDSKIIHVRWSGEGGWIPMGDLDVGIGPENATRYPSPGELIFYPGRRQRDRAPPRLRLRRVREQGGSARRQPLRDDRLRQREPPRARPPHALGRRPGHLVQRDVATRSSASASTSTASSTSSSDESSSGEWLTPPLRLRTKSIAASTPAAARMPASCPAPDGSSTTGSPARRDRVPQARPATLP